LPPSLEAHVVEDVELRLGTEEHRVGDAGRAQPLLGLRRDLARVTPVRLTGARLDDGERDVQRLRGTERVDVRGRRVRDQLHVRLVNGGEPADRAAVEHEAFLEGVRIEPRGGHVEVLLLAREVREPDVDELDTLVLDEP
jgi:hypothetical protein